MESICTKNGNKRDLITLLSIFGIKSFINKLGCEYIFMYSDEYLYEHGFKIKSFPRVRYAGLRGRPCSHLRKSDGKIKCGYSNKNKIIQTELQKLLLPAFCFTFDTRTVQIVKNKIQQIIKKRENAATTIAKHLRGCFARIKVKMILYIANNEYINILTDVITMDDIIVPTIIQSDWDNGSFIIYNLKTILNFRKYNYVPTHVDIDSDGYEIVREFAVPTKKFTSPFTRTSFDSTQIVVLPDWVLSIANSIRKKNTLHCK